MGNCFGSEPVEDGPGSRSASADERRALQAAAAQKRQQASASRGLRDEEAAKRLQAKSAASAKLDRKGQVPAGSDGGLKWAVS
eukprot:m.183065 g.183065  ORF g.183065 m.183065 type:complete len:83 (+) comp14987_c0_seq1:183-431(+)